MRRYAICKKLLMAAIACAGVYSAALAQQAAAQAPAAQQQGLAPPGNKYFTGKGSWGQTYPDQWGLARIGFNSSPQSAWRLVKADAQPVTVAIIDTGLDWNHKNFSWSSLWHNPQRAAPNADKSQDAYAGADIGWNFVDQNSKPWDYDGHGTMVAGIIAASWTDKDGMAGINPLVRLMVLKAVNNFGHTRASYVAEA
jgi:subtilisin family serine protease